MFITQGEKKEVFINERFLSSFTYITIYILYLFVFLEIFHNILQRAHAPIIDNTEQIREIGITAPNFFILNPEKYTAVT